MFGSDGMPQKDRRTQRSQTLLREALFALVREKGFESLTVQEILDRANVGRATFYAHFQNKEDLLVSGLDDVRAALKERQKGSRERFAFARDLFAHTEEHRSLFRALAGKDSGGAILRIWRKTILELIREEVKHDEAAAQFLAGGLYGLLVWWLEGKPELTLDEIDAAFRRLAAGTAPSRSRL
jgi:AcrR family transcriptional regulator